eukprot:6185993-Pleurochrysis_carterae.AAC.7
MRGAKKHHVVVARCKSRRSSSTDNLPNYVATSTSRSPEVQGVQHADESRETPSGTETEKAGLLWQKRWPSVRTDSLKRRDSQNEIYGISRNILHYCDILSNSSLGEWRRDG